MPISDIVNWVVEEVESLARALLDKETLEAEDLKVLLGCAVTSAVSGGPAPAAGLAASN